MQTVTWLSMLLFSLALTSCVGLFGAIFVEPGETLRLIAASQYQVTYEYTHSYDSELPAAGRAADAQCSRFGKHAALASNVRKNLDRSIVTFVCQ